MERNLGIFKFTSNLADPESIARMGPELGGLRTYGVDDVIVVCGGAKKFGWDVVKKSWQGVDERAEGLLVARPEALDDIQSMLEAGRMPVVNGDDIKLPEDSPFLNNDCLTEAIVQSYGHRALTVLKVSLDPIRDFANDGRTVPWLHRRDIDGAHKYIRSSTSENGTGGAGSVLSLAGTAVDQGVEYVAVLDGRQPRPLTGVLSGEVEATYFVPD